jgi:hypothetical protein
LADIFLFQRIPQSVVFNHDFTSLLLVFYMWRAYNDMVRVCSLNAFESYEQSWRMDGMKLALKCVNGVKSLFKKIRFRMKLREMDDMWRLTGGGCFGDYPPSFYYTHTPEEAKRIKQEEIARLKAMLDEYCEENGLAKTDWNKISGGDHDAGKEDMCGC